MPGQLEVSLLPDKMSRDALHRPQHEHDAPGSDALLRGPETAAAAAVSLSHEADTQRQVQQTDGATLSTITTAIPAGLVSDARPDAPLAVSKPAMAETSFERHRIAPAGAGDASGDAKMADVDHELRQERRGLSTAAQHSQDTAHSSAEPERVFTPSDSEASNGGPGTPYDGGLSSSQDSSLLQLSQVAAAQERLQTPDGNAATSGTSRKRMADGAVKPPGEERSSTSPVRPVGAGHSRNTSTVSMSSTTNRLAEVCVGHSPSPGHVEPMARPRHTNLSCVIQISFDLKTRLSYAMVKVSRNLEDRSLDEVESLASQGASPTSTNSTAQRRHSTSPSPLLAGPSPQTPTPLSAGALQSRSNAFDAFSRGTKPHQVTASASPPVGHRRAQSTLGPPAPIHSSRSPQPARPLVRRNSNPRYTPSYLSHHTAPSPSTAPTTPAAATTAYNSQRSTPIQPPSLRTPIVDPILFSPVQDLREQDAVESLMRMSSPNNSATLQHSFPHSAPSSQQTLSQSQPQSQTEQQPTAAPPRDLSVRHPLPSSRPRKALPTGRPSSFHATTSSPQQSNGRGVASRRVGFDSPAENAGDRMDVDFPDSPHRSGRVSTPRSQGHHHDRMNGGSGRTQAAATTPTIVPPSSISLGLGIVTRADRTDDELDRLVEQRRLSKLAAAGASASAGGAVRTPTTAAATTTAGRSLASLYDDESSDDGEIILPPKHTRPVSRSQQIGGHGVRI